MSDPFVGEIRMFAGNFAPYNWAFCQGQIIPIQSNTALFALLGTYYGGNGQTNFALPDLRGNVPLGAGNGIGLTPHVIGERSGTPTVTLLSSEMPMHGHGLNASSANGSVPPGSGATLGRPVKGSLQGSTTGLMYSTGGANVPMTTPVLGISGGSQPHNNMMPYLAMNYIIALRGVFPARN